MFSKPLFRQTLKENYKLWLIFTIIMTVFSTLMVVIYNPGTMAGLTDMLKDSPMGDLIGGQLAGMTSLLGTLANNFYGMMGVILPTIYIIIIANKLVAAQVDNGSMAYTLSTPIKRSKVIATQALYLISSLVAMILVVVITCLGMVQVKHQGLTEQKYPADVAATASVLNMDEAEIYSKPKLVMNNPQALSAGAQARAIEEDVYESYLGMKLLANAIDSASDILGISSDEIMENPAVLLEDNDALLAVANVMGEPVEELRAEIENSTSTDNEEAADLQEVLTVALEAAADVLDIEVSELTNDLKLMKNNPAALAAASEASDVSEDGFITIINMQLANKELIIDEGVNFDLKAYLQLNLGWLLLLFAISSISFAASCIFNLSKNAMAFGAGLPIAFFVLQMLSNTGESLAGFKYLSLNSLFSPTTIIDGGGFAMQFSALTIIGIVLYCVGLQWFKNKDLPL